MAPVEKPALFSWIVKLSRVSAGRMGEEDRQECLSHRLAFSGANQGEEFVAGLLIVTEAAKHGAGYSRAVLLLNTAHLHAQVARLDDDADTLGTDFFLNRLSNLAGHAFLDLQPASEHIYQAGDFAEPEYTLVRQVGYVGFAKEREQVVFAKTEEFDVLHHHHFIVGNAKSCAVEKVVNVLMIA